MWIVEWESTYGQTLHTGFPDEDEAKAHFDLLRDEGSEPLMWEADGYWETQQTDEFDLNEPGVEIMVAWK